MKSFSNQILDAYSKLRPANVSDALNALGLKGALNGLLPVLPASKILGGAYTLRYTPCTAHAGTVGDYMEDLPPGAVVVIDNAGRVDCTVWGYLLTVAAKRQGVAGAVIDGACRDLGIIEEHAFPVYTRGRSNLTGKGKVMLEQTQVPVTVGGVRVCPGDLMMGGRSGVVCVPGRRVESVLKISRAIKAAEDQAAEMTARGVSLKEARERVGYHWLQSPASKRAPGVA